MQISVGEYLIDQLKDIGIDKIFGVPGDFNLEFLELFEQNPNKVEFIENCNELNASYAADGYARVNSISALLVTYSVGDLSAINGIAGAYAEDIPMIVISGTPPIHALSSRALLHHTLADGNYDNIISAVSKFTVAQTRVTPQNAISEIPRVLRTCLIEKKPVYIQLPSDICNVKINAPKVSDCIDYAFKSDENMLELATNFLISKLTQSHNPILIIDSLVNRFNLSTSLELLINKLNIPFVTLNSAKGAINENSKYFFGTYSGKNSSKEVYEYIKNSDCIIEFGARFTDFNSGYFTQSIDKSKSIKIYAYSMNSENYSLNGIYCKDLIENILNSKELKIFEFNQSFKNKKSNKIYEDNQKITQDSLWQEVYAFLKNDDVIIAETGSSLTAMNQAKLPKGTTFISQTIWGSIGYSLGATLGASLAARDKRALLFIGDGSFQMTAQELSTILRLKLKPIIFLLNNGGYVVEKEILGKKESFNKIQNWKYSKLCEVFSQNEHFETFEVFSNKDLKDALKACEKPNNLKFIEIFLGTLDASKSLKKMGQEVANYDYNKIEKK